MAVTRQEYEAFLICPLNSHLLASGEPASATALTEAQTELDDTFQKHGAVMYVCAPPTGAVKEYLFQFILDWLIATLR